MAFRKISYLPLELPVLTGATFLLFEDFDAFIGAPVLTGFFETASFLILTFFRVSSLVSLSSTTVSDFKRSAFNNKLYH